MNDLCTPVNSLHQKSAIKTRNTRAYTRTRETSIFVSQKQIITVRKTFRAKKWIVREARFGASKQYDAASGESTTTLLGYTPGYAPLEQTEGNVRQFLLATDIYALGATLYRLLTGHTPPSPSYRISEEEMQPLPDSISAGTRQAVEQAMMLNKKKRPQTVHEFIALLDAAVKPAPQPNPIPPTPPTPPTPPAPSPYPPETSSWIYAIIVAIILCSILIIVFAKGGCAGRNSEFRDSIEDSYYWADSAARADSAAYAADSAAYAEEVIYDAPAVEYDSICE